MKSSINNTIVTITTTERISRAQYSSEYTELYTRLYEAGKCPDTYVGHIGEGFHPARFAEVSNTSVDSCVALRSYQRYNFYEEAASILGKFTRKALSSGMPVEELFHGLRARLSRIIRTWDNWVRGELEEQGFFQQLEGLCELLEYEEAQIISEVAWLLNHDTLGEEWQEAILSLLSPEMSFLEAFEDAYEEASSVELTESEEARFERALLNNEEIPGVNWDLHNAALVALHGAAKAWNSIREFARTEKNSRAIREFDRVFSEAREEFADGFYTRAIRTLREARCILSEIF